MQSSEEMGEERDELRHLPSWVPVLRELAHRAVELYGDGDEDPSEETLGPFNGQEGQDD